MVDVTILCVSELPYVMSSSLARDALILSFLLALLEPEGDIYHVSFSPLRNLSIITSCCNLVSSIERTLADVNILCVCELSGIVYA